MKLFFLLGNQLFDEKYLEKFKKEEPQGLFKLAIFTNLKFSELAFENESIKINRKKNFFTLG